MIDRLQTNRNVIRFSLMPSLGSEPFLDHGEQIRSDLPLRWLCTTIRGVHRVVLMISSPLEAFFSRHVPTTNRSLHVQSARIEQLSKLHNNSGLVVNFLRFIECLNILGMSAPFLWWMNVCAIPTVPHLAHKNKFTFKL